VVIGSGFAGLAAAIEAKQKGASVVVLEKMRVAGGNSIINGGVMAVAGSDMQEAKGIKDTPDLMLEDMMKAGLYLNYPELARMVAYQSKSAYEWCKAHLGCKFGGMLLHMGGHTVARSCPTGNYSGSGIVLQEVAKLKELGVPVTTGVYLEKIFKGVDGKIAGIQVRENYRFPKDDSGTAKTVRTRKGLVMTTGGFGQDVRYRMVQDPKLTDKVDSTNQPGATSAAKTNTAVTSFRSLGFNPQRRAIAMRSRKRMVPRITPATVNPRPVRPTRASPRIRLASPQTIIPIPICTSANP